MIKIKEAIVVEGKYDKIKVSRLINTIIIKTDGFRIFKDKDKLNLIKNLAEDRGIIILTDSDAAGFLIRNYIKGSVTKGEVRHAYIPDIVGKEKRKESYSKEGKLGVEGVDDEIILSAIQNCVKTVKKLPIELKIDRLKLYSAKLIGHENSKKLRKSLLLDLNLPEYFSVNNLLEFLNYMAEDNVYYDTLKKYNLTQ